jgi:hypothetical protein
MMNVRVLCKHNEFLDQLHILQPKGHTAHVGHLLRTLAATCACCCAWCDWGFSVGGPSFRHSSPCSYAKSLLLRLFTFSCVSFSSSQPLHSGVRGCTQPYSNNLRPSVEVSIPSSYSEDSGFEAGPVMTEIWGKVKVESSVVLH